jgi:hypothetical protein
MNQPQARTGIRPTRNARPPAEAPAWRPPAGVPAWRPPAEATSAAGADSLLRGCPAYEELLLPAGLADTVHRAGAWLSARGIRAGDVVAMCAPDSFDATVTRYAISSTGAVAVTLSPLSSRRELFAQLCGSGARWLVTTSDLFVQKLEVAARPSAVIATFLIGRTADGTTTPGVVRFDVLA